MTAPFRQLLNRYAMLGFERELLLVEQLGDDPEWSLSLEDGTATIGGRTYGVQLLGTRADETNSWRWAWADKGAPVPAKVLEAAKKVKATGRKRECPELLEAELPFDALEELDPHQLSLVATGIAELPAYYRFPYAGGALFAALEIPDFRLPPASARRIAHVVREVVSRMDLDDRIAFDGYMVARGAKLAKRGEQFRASFADGTIVAEFDAHGRLDAVGVESLAATAAPA